MFVSHASGWLFEELGTSIFKVEVSRIKLGSSYTGLHYVTLTGKRWAFWVDWNNRNGAQWIVTKWCTVNCDKIVLLVYRNHTGSLGNNVYRKLTTCSATWKLLHAIMTHKFNVVSTLMYSTNDICEYTNLQNNWLSSEGILRGMCTPLGRSAPDENPVRVQPRTIPSPQHFCHRFGVCPPMLAEYECSTKQKQYTFHYPVHAKFWGWSMKTT